MINLSMHRSMDTAKAIARLQREMKRDRAAKKSRAERAAATIGSASIDPRMRHLLSASADRSGMDLDSYLGVLRHSSEPKAEPMENESPMGNSELRHRIAACAQSRGLTLDEYILKMAVFNGQPMKNIVEQIDIERRISAFHEANESRKRLR